MKTVLVFAAGILSGALNPEKPAYLHKNELIRQAHIAVIGKIKGTRKACEPENEWTYCKFIKASIDSVLWGTNDSTLFFLSTNDLRNDAKDDSKPRFLMFVYENISAKTAMNWNRSAFEIKEDSVLWFKDTTSIDLEYQPLKIVLENIRAIRTETKKEGASEVKGSN